MSPIRRLLVAACWLAVVMAYVAAMMPARDAPHLGGSDKLDHMAAFFTISLLARSAYRRVPVGVLMLIVSAFGGFIEVCQALPIIHRDAEWGDWIADMAATAIGLTAAWPIVTWWERGHAKPA